MLPSRGMGPKLNNHAQVVFSDMAQWRALTLVLGENLTNLFIFIMYSLFEINLKKINSRIYLQITYFESILV